VLAVIPATLVGILVLQWLGGISEGSFVLDRVVTSVISGMAVGSAMLVTYLGLLWLFKSPELREVSKQLGARFGRKSK